MLRQPGIELRGAETQRDGSAVKEAGRLVNFHHVEVPTFFLAVMVISRGLSVMDTRLLVIAAPVLVAASWALFNIGRLAIQQIQRLSR